MKLFFLTTFIIFFSITSKAEILKPSSLITPKEVISIQLTALQNNNYPYENAGIEQTWEFAHPSNRQYTGPLEKFTLMMYSSSYSIMLEHKSHKIILVEENDSMTFYFIELIDKAGNQFGFQWILEKVFLEGEYNNCWMTVSVSRPIPISKGT